MCTCDVSGDYFTLALDKSLYIALTNWKDMLNIFAENKLSGIWIFSAMKY